MTSLTRARAPRASLAVSALVSLAWSLAVVGCLPPDEVYGRACDDDADCANDLDRAYVCAGGTCLLASSVDDDDAGLPPVDAGDDEDAGGPDPDSGVVDAGPPIEAVCVDALDDDGDGAPDCADGDCQGTAACGPGAGAPGAPCAAHTDCASTTNDPHCFTEQFSGIPGGACSEWCDPLADDCGANAVCVETALTDAFGVCVAVCDDDADCTAPLVCRPFGAVSACLAPPCTHPLDCGPSSTCDVASGACVDIPVCGDGALQIGETCDDGNLVGEDGCTNTCLLEGGVFCEGEPSQCAPIVCGDGRVDPPEPCDDGNTYPLDGCTGACTLATGVVCIDEPSRCALFPVEWVCSFFSFGDGVCDCGCEAVDIDCPLPLVVDACDIGCGDGIIDPSEPTLCLPPACGNGAREGFESCDDGNTSNGDGCDGTCAIEAGYACHGSPSSCVGVPVTWTCPVFLYDDDTCDCGCGTVDTDCPSPLTVDACERVNCPFGDFLDEGAPFSCLSPVCGDGLIETIERCDDGNVADGDGCSATCFVESGFACQGTPSLCAPAVCGDGSVDLPEACDDGALVDGDGCSATCTLELDYVCGGAPSSCVTGWTCTPSFYADSICDCGCSVADPDCVDVVLVSGCYNNCQPGSVDPDDLTQCFIDVCGDAITGVLELCDDGDASAGDGCAPDCTVEPGFVCVGSPSLCRPIVCGDGAVDDGEGCDDGNANAGDGCAACVIEPNFGCYASPSVCAAIVCGDGVITLGEQCDDANLVDADGCSASCIIEPNATCEGQPSICRVVPDGWTCPPQYWDNDDGCDCGCAVFDPDCPATTSDVCEFCNEEGSCNTQPACPGDLLPNDNTTCIL